MANVIPSPEYDRLMVWLCWVFDRLHGAGTMVAFGEMWWPEKGRP